MSADDERIIDAFLKRLRGIGDEPLMLVREQIGDELERRYREAKMRQREDARRFRAQSSAPSSPKE